MPNLDGIPIIIRTSATPELYKEMTKLAHNMTFADIY